MLQNSKYNVIGKCLNLPPSDINYSNIKLVKFKMTIEQIIEKQMQAYDDRDIDSMMSVFSEDIKIIDFSSNKTLIDGINECRRVFVDLFKQSPKLRAEILKTITFDNKVIVQEYIHGRNGSNEQIEQVIIFEINNKKITKINMIREGI